MKTKHKAKESKPLPDQPAIPHRKEQVARDSALHRQRLPPTRQSITHKFSVAGHEGYLIVGLYDEGQPGELFVKMAKEGSTIGGLMDTFGITASLALQWGVPLEVLVEKLSFTRFEPSGDTQTAALPKAQSIVDYIARWLGLMFLQSKLHDTNHRKADETATIPSNDKRTSASPKTLRSKQPKQFDKQFAHFQADAPPCKECGSITVRNGNCYLCHNCGTSQGF